MAIAIDTSVLLDFRLNDPKFGAKSARALEAHLDDGLVVCETVIAEIISSLKVSVEDFLADSEIQFVPSSLESATLAGEMFAEYRRRGGSRARVVPDFLIAAQAQTLGLPLLARDSGYYRDYFRNLVVITP